MPAEPTARCRRVAATLAALEPGEAIPDDLDHAHLRRCGRCQAVQREYLLLRDALASLRSTEVAWSPDAPDAVRRAVEEEALRAAARRRGWRVATVSGLAAAATAGAAGAIVVQGLHRRARLAG